MRALRAQVGLSERRACRLVGVARSTYQYRGHRDPAAPLRERLRTLAEQRRRFGYRRLTVLLRREGFRVNHKRVYRLYREEGLAVRRRKRKPVQNAHSESFHGRFRDECLNEAWFLTLADARRIIEAWRRD